MSGNLPYFIRKNVKVPIFFSCFKKSVFLIWFFIKVWKNRKSPKQCFVRNNLRNKSTKFQLQLLWFAWVEASINFYLIGGKWQNSDLMTNILADESLFWRKFLTSNLCTSRNYSPIYVRPGIQWIQQKGYNVVEWIQ